MIFVAQTRDGGRIEYHDGKRYLWLFSLTTPLFPTVSILLYHLFGHPLWLASGLVFAYVGVTLLDMLVGEDVHNPPEAIIEQLASDQYYRALLYLYIPLLYFNFFLVAHTIATVGIPWWAVAVLAYHCGAVNGAALTVGHELGHKQSRLDRFAAQVVNALPAYAHFCLEHNRGHHTEVATPGDPASAKMGENVYAFSLHEQFGGIRRGARFERERLARKGLGFWHWRNEILQGYALTALIWIAVMAIWGWAMIFFLLVQTYVAWWQLTLANYVEHYGLLRRRQNDGRYEPCQPRHSWNTNHIVSNVLLFHLQRHSDHHANPLRPYQTLRDFDELPRLPSGYPGCFMLAMAPPLWFRVMDPKVMAWAGGDPSKVNRLL